MSQIFTLQYLVMVLFMLGCMVFGIFLSEGLGAAFRRDRDRNFFLQALAASALVSVMGGLAIAGFLGAATLLLKR